MLDRKRGKYGFLKTTLRDLKTREDVAAFTAVWREEAHRFPHRLTKKVDLLLTLLWSRGEQVPSFWNKPREALSSIELKYYYLSPRWVRRIMGEGHPLIPKRNP